MANTKLSYKDQVNSCKSMEDLEAMGVTFDDVKKAIIAKEVQRLAHKKNYLRKQAVLARIKAEHPELLAEVDAEIA